jgi:glycerol-1-phosphate dehydrogenase [NAD(P)+]
MIEGQTNVISGLFGRGVIQGLGQTLPRFLVTTMPDPWAQARERLGGHPAGVVMADSMEIETLERQLAEAPPADVIVAIGGGRAIDMGKFFAWKRGCRLVTIPTALTVDAFVTPAAGVRRGHQVEYVGAASPDPLVIDYDLLRTAPRELNIAGVGDLLSIHTATRDWEIAAEAGRDTHGFSAEDVRQARAILDRIYELRLEIRYVTDDGLQAIVDGYMKVNTLCLPAGHYRVEEGSEHFLFYELEERLGRPFLHGEIVALGVYLMSRLQQNRPEWVRHFLEELGLNYQPGPMGIPRQALIESLLHLRDYVEQRGHWYSVIQERAVTEEWVQEAIADLQF